MIVRLKPLEWFEKYAYKDIDGDWWLTKELYDEYNLTEDKVEAGFYLDASNNPYSGLVDLSDTAARANFQHYSWAIDEYYTQKNNPEYFL